MGPRHRRFPSTQPKRSSIDTSNTSNTLLNNRNHGQLPRLHLRYRAGQGQLLLLLQDWRLPSRRPLLQKTRQAVVLADYPAAQPLPEPGVRPQEQDEPAADADAL